MRRATLLLAVILCAAGLAGCGGNSNPVEGSWSGRCTSTGGQVAELSIRFGDTGQYSSSSTGADGESSGTYNLRGPTMLTVQNSAGEQFYQFKVITDVLTLMTHTQDREQTCNLRRK